MLFQATIINIDILINYEDNKYNTILKHRIKFLFRTIKNNML